jgi:hypothetical protein
MGRVRKQEVAFRKAAMLSGGAVRDAGRMAAGVA